MPITFDRATGEIGLSGGIANAVSRLARLARSFRFDLRHFAGFGADSSVLRMRWIFLRLLGLVLALTFFELWRDGPGLLGPHGLYPIDENLERAYAAHGDLLACFVRIPTLFWLSPTTAMIKALALGGLSAAIALTCNVFPRFACLVSWLCLESFISGGQLPFLLTPDALLCETTFLAVFLAPSGLRPRAGESSPPPPLAVLALRWLLFRLMLESGISKYVGGDAAWLNLTAMDSMHVTSSLPTFGGYLLQLAPHWFHVLETVVMILAEFVAPLLSLMGRGGSLVAFFLIVLLQLGIAFSANFGHLNTVTMILALMLLDDRTLCVLGLAPANRLRAVKDPVAARSMARKACSSLLAVLLAMSSLTFLEIFTPLTSVLPVRLVAFNRFLYRLNVCDVYHLYHSMLTEKRWHIEITGSNDGGKTWRLYEYRSLPQGLAELSPFFPLGHPRFDAALNILASLGGSEMPALGQLLLRPGSEIVGLFRADPFPDKPPEQLRFTRFEYRMNDYRTYSETGHIWSRTRSGAVLEVSLTEPPRSIP